MERQIEISYRLLKFQMGMPLSEKITLSENLTLLIRRLRKNKIENKSFIPEMNINFKIADTAVKSSNMLLKKEKSTFLPSLSAYFTYSKNAMRNDFNFLKKSGERWYPSIVAGLNLNFPIFSSGLRASRVQQSKMELIKAINARNEVKRGLELNYAKALSNYKNARNNSKTLGNSVKLAKRIYNKFLLKYKEGVSSSMEMIQAYNQYLGVEINYRNSIIQLSTAGIELEKVLNKM
jgi:outer membrane protein TolC